MTRRDGAGEVAERVKPGAPFNGGDPRSGRKPFIGVQRLDAAEDRKIRGAAGERNIFPRTAQRRAIPTG